MSATPFSSHHAQRYALVPLCALMFFVELTLIRWVSANIAFLAFFTNFVLLASFLGIGCAFLRAPYARPLFHLSPLALTALIYFCYHFQYQYQPHFNFGIDDLSYNDVAFQHHLIPTWISLPIVFMLVTLTMLMIGDGVARAFRALPPLTAYRYDIVGSLLGIVMFSALSYWQLTPLWWGITISLCYITAMLAIPRQPRFTHVMATIALCAMNSVLIHASVSVNNHWSAYYRIEIQPYSHARYAVNVNGLPQQFIESVAQRHQYKPFYFYPYQHLTSHTTLHHVLVVGAGTGGDVAIALAAGAQHVDAVEIDPTLYALGQRFNPNHVYQDPRVHIHLEDGRSFLQRTQQRYDLILFALPDSIAILSGQSSLRLENYLFTLEAMTTMRAHLTPTGVFTMYNYYRDRWLVDRLMTTLNSVFQHAACLDTQGEANHWLSVLTISRDPHDLRCDRRLSPSSPVKVQPITDDYPFLYLAQPTLPAMYGLMLGFVALYAAILLRMQDVRLSTIRTYPDFFLLGAAFVLLETKSVVNFALFFGSTWFVNALVFIGILATVFVGIEVTERHPARNTWHWWLLLFGALGMQWLTPNAFILTLPVALRFACACALAFTPIFIGNVIFADQLRQTQGTIAFGANLMGAVAGGIAEYASLIIGYRHLLLIIAVCYLAAFCCSHRYGWRTWTSQKVSVRP